MNMRDYRLLIRYIRRTYGVKRTRAVIRDANAAYDSFRGSIEAAGSRVERLHVTMIAEKCAIYLALKKHFPDRAYKWIDRVSRVNIKPVHDMLDSFTALPGGGYALVRLFVLVKNVIFGKPAGFSAMTLKKEKDASEFHILKCPYCEYCVKFGCKELIKTFCDCDFYVFGNLRGAEFSRTQTLGTDGDRCDFHMKVRKREE